MDVVDVADVHVVGAAWEGWRDKRRGTVDGESADRSEEQSKCRQYLTGVVGWA